MNKEEKNVKKSSENKQAEKRPDRRETSKVERVPVHRQKSMITYKRDGYTVRMVNDTPGRIDTFLKAGWKIVEDSSGKYTTYNQGMSQMDSPMGSAITQIVNKGIDAPCRVAVLMEIPTEWYEADQAEKQKEINEIEATFDQSGVHKSSGMYGGIERTDNTKA